MSLPGATLVGGVRLYQYVIRPMIGGGHCRYAPCCSNYAIQAFRRHGAARGTLLATRRLLRCNPWMPGGDDPVPLLRRTEGQGSAPKERGSGAVVPRTTFLAADAGADD